MPGSRSKSKRTNEPPERGYSRESIAGSKRSSGGTAGAIETEELK